MSWQLSRPLVSLSSDQWLDVCLAAGNKWSMTDINTRANTVQYVHQLPRCWESVIPQQISEWFEARGEGVGKWTVGLHFSETLLKWKIRSPGNPWSSAKKNAKICLRTEHTCLCIGTGQEQTGSSAEKDLEKPWMPTHIQAKGMFSLWMRQTAHRAALGKAQRSDQGELQSLIAQY